MSRKVKMDQVETGAVSITVSESEPSSLLELDKDLKDAGVGLYIKGSVPEIGMNILVPKEFDDVFTWHGKYCVDGWLKKEPMTPPVPRGDPFMDDFLTKLFHEEHPNPETECRMRWCNKDEATHVSAGIGIIKLEDIECTGDYAPWHEEILRDKRESMSSRVGKLVDHTFSADR